MKPETSQGACTLLIRLPSGVSTQHSFSSTDSLQEVRVWLDEFHPMEDAYSFILTYPKRSFTIQEEQQSLYELKLCPRSAIAILKAPKTYTIYRSPLAKFTAIFSYLFGRSTNSETPQSRFGEGKTLVDPVNDLETSQGLGVSSKEADHQFSVMNAFNILEEPSNSERSTRASSPALSAQSSHVSLPLNPHSARSSMLHATGGSRVRTLEELDSDSEY